MDDELEARLMCVHSMTVEGCLGCMVGAEERRITAETGVDWTEVYAHVPFGTDCGRALADTLDLCESCRLQQVVADMCGEPVSAVRSFDPLPVEASRRRSRRRANKRARTARRRNRNG